MPGDGGARTLQGRRNIGVVVDVVGGEIGCLEAGRGWWGVQVVVRAFAFRRQLDRGHDADGDGEGSGRISLMW